MTTRLFRNWTTGAGLAALLITSACSSTAPAPTPVDTSDTIVTVSETPTMSAPVDRANVDGTIMVDRDGNVYTAGRSEIASANVTTFSDGTPTIATRTVTTTVPAGDNTSMISSSQEETTTTRTSTRTRLRKD